MKIQVEQKENCEAILTVEIDPPAVETALQKAARRLSEKKTIPGFRKGKAPYARVVQEWGEDAVLDEALDALGPEVYRQALDEQNITPSAVGTMKRIVSRQPLVLEFLVPVQPVIDLGEYRSVRVPFEENSIPEEDIDRAMDQLRESHSILEPVSRPAEKGDVLSVDVQAGIVRDGGKIEPLVFEGEENPQELDLDDNLGGRFPGAGNALVGITEGEIRRVPVRFPDSFPVVRLKGREAQLTVKCLGVKIRKMPEWNEDLVQEISVFSTVEELRKEVRSRLEKSAEESKEEDYADSVIEKMVEGAKVTFPPAMLEEEIAEEIQTLGRRLLQRKTSLEVYLRTIPEGMAGLQKQLEPEARRKLIRRLLLTELVKHEGLEPSAQEIDKQVAVYQSVLDNSKAKKKESMEKTLRQLASNDVLSRLIVQRLMQIGRGTAPEPPASVQPTEPGGST
jgi:trigger factor